MSIPADTRVATQAICPIIYWLPGVCRKVDIPSAWLQRWDEYAVEVNVPGPGEGRGTFVARQGPILVYRPELQRWDDHGDYWVGVRRDLDPAELARPVRVSRHNYVAVLGDGRGWQIPIANPLLDSLGLPYWRKLDRAGAMVREVKDAYRQLSWQAAELAGRWKTCYLENTELDLADDEAEHLLADALAVGYDLTFAECSALRLFDPACYFTALGALIDWPTIRALIEANREAPPGHPTEATSGT